MSTALVALVSPSSPCFTAASPRDNNRFALTLFWLDPALLEARRRTVVLSRAFLSLVLRRFSSPCSCFPPPAPPLCLANYARDYHFTATISLYSLHPLPLSFSLVFHTRPLADTRGAHTRLQPKNNGPRCIRGVRGERREQECAARAYLANATHTHIDATLPCRVRSSLVCRPNDLSLSLFLFLSCRLYISLCYRSQTRVIARHPL